MYLNKIMALCDKPTANMVSKGEMLKTFPLRSCQSSPFVFKIVRGDLARAIREEQETKVTQIGNEEQLLVFAYKHRKFQRLHSKTVRTNK